MFCHIKPLDCGQEIQLGSIGYRKTVLKKVLTSLVETLWRIQLYKWNFPECQTQLTLAFIFPSLFSFNPFLCRTRDPGPGLTNTSVIESLYDFLCGAGWSLKSKQSKLVITRVLALEFGRRVPNCIKYISRGTHLSLGIFLFIENPLIHSPAGPGEHDLDNNWYHGCVCKASLLLLLVMNEWFSRLDRRLDQNYKIYTGIEISVCFINRMSLNRCQEMSSCSHIR